jgi:hypothetical protein
VAVLQRQELQAVGVLEILDGRGVDSSHRRRDLLRARIAAKRGASADLSLELALGPATLDGREHVELALLRVLRLAEEDQVMRPRQLCHQR